ncbi:helix-turn-helix domain-containing protein [Nonomuraea polychroma]|uniref:helix-turn-helix domain-containing protein n=1 Tax=Nonomuraea polychroma TaxID=46176 RepID=UPI003D91AAAC
MSNETTSSVPEPDNLAHDGDPSTTPLDELLFLKLDEVATFLNVSRRTVDQLVRTGELKSHRIRGNRRVSRRHLDEYIEQAANDDRPTLGERHQEVVRRSRRDRTKTNA